MDSHQHLWVIWSTVLAHRWETALLRDKIAFHYQDLTRPPRWDASDPLLFVPRNFAAVVKRDTEPWLAGFGPHPAVQSIGHGTAVEDVAESLVLHPAQPRRPSGPIAFQQALDSVSLIPCQPQASKRRQPTADPRGDMCRASLGRNIFLIRVFGRYGLRLEPRLPRSQDYFGRVAAVMVRPVS